MGAPLQSVPHSGVGLKQMRTLRADGSPAPRTGGRGGHGGEAGEEEEEEAAFDLEALAGELDGGEEGGEEEAEGGTTGEVVA